MAKLGEGDKRWIVEDRADGTNVHNWHWVETNCLEWSRKFLEHLICDKTLLSGEGNLYIKINKVEKFDREAYVNVRKGKIIPCYELNLVVSYEAEARDSDGKSVLLKIEGSTRLVPLRLFGFSEVDEEVVDDVVQQTPSIGLGFGNLGILILILILCGRII